MTVSTTTVRETKTGDGATVSWSFAFQALDAAHVYVKAHDTAAGTITELTQDVDFSVTLTGTTRPAAGSIALLGTYLATPPASTVELEIYRVTPKTQPVPLDPRSSFASASPEAMFDRFMLIGQEWADLAERVLRLDDGDGASIDPLPSAESRASKYLGFDADGNPMAVAAAASTALISAFVQTLIDDTTNTAFAATLGAPLLASANTFTANQAITYSLAGTVSLTVKNSRNTAGSDHAKQTISAGGTSGGDAWTEWVIPSGSTWSAGVDNSDSDAFVLSLASGLGSSNVMRWTSGLATLYANGLIPAFEQVRQDAHGAAAQIGSLDFYGKDSAANTELYASIYPWCVDHTNASEDAELYFWTKVAGTGANRAKIGQGFVVGSPTGGDKGVGTGNFTAAYDDNVILTDYVFDRFLGRKGRYSARVRAAAKRLDPRWFDPAKYAAFWKKHRRLPGMPDLDDCIDGIVKEKSLGAMIQLLWQTAELQAIHIEHARARNDALEARLARLEARL